MADVDPGRDGNGPRGRPGGGDPRRQRLPGGLRRPGLTLAIHLCRGNNRSHWYAEGGYDPIAEKLFATLDVDRFLLEYDDARSGGFEPLRFVPRGKAVVLGLVSSKVPALESKADLRRRIEEAARVVPLDRPGPVAPSAASPPRSTGTSCPRRSSGPSSGWSWRRPGRCGASRRAPPAGAPGPVDARARGPGGPALAAPRRVGVAVADTFPLRAVAALFLERQHLARPRARALTPAGWCRFVEDAGGLQLDSINVLDRAHYLTVWSRFGPYDRARLDRLVYRRRLLFEYWAHAACLVPVSHLPRGGGPCSTTGSATPGGSVAPAHTGRAATWCTEAIRDRAGRHGSADFEHRRPPGRRRMVEPGSPCSTRSTTSG